MFIEIHIHASKHLSCEGVYCEDAVVNYSDEVEVNQQTAPVFTFIELRRPVVKKSRLVDQFSKVD